MEKPTNQPKKEEYELLPDEYIIRQLDCGGCGSKKFGFLGFLKQSICVQCNVCGVISYKPMHVHPCRKLTVQWLE